MTGRLNFVIICGLVVVGIRTTVPNIYLSPAYAGPNPTVMMLTDIYRAIAVVEPVKTIPEPAANIYCAAIFGD